MFGTVLKNTVLFLLIIFILHFMINNLLIDMDLNNIEEKKNNGNLPSPVEDNSNVIDNSKMVEVDRAQPERDEKKDKDVLKMKQLYDYVYEKDADKKLDSFFKKSNDIDVNNSKDVQVKCVDSLCSNINNYCNTSLPIKQEIQGHYSNFNKVQCEGDLKEEEHKHVYLVKKYNNENAMNGGKLDETNIEAFDTLDDCFETL
jgi:hypothetical protein